MHHATCSLQASPPPCVHAADGHVIKAKCCLITGQVRVWLGTDQDHYYVLSRFLVSRMLTVTKLPPLKAVKIALELKKALVDSERLNLTQVSVVDDRHCLFEAAHARDSGRASFGCIYCCSVIGTHSSPAPQDTLCTVGLADDRGAAWGDKQRVTHDSKPVGMQVRASAMPPS